MKITGILNFGFIPQKPIKMSFLFKGNNLCSDMKEFSALSSNHFLSFGKRIDLKDYKDEITKLHNEGKSAREIAKIIGCSHAGISYAIKRWELGERGDKDLELKQEVLKLYKNGKSITDISEMTGSSKTRISKILKENNIKLRLMPAVDNRERIVELYKGGMTQKEIGNTIGCSQSAVSNILRMEKATKSKPRAINVIEPNKDIIIKLYKRGETITDIAKWIGCSIGGIQYSLKKWGVEQRQDTTLKFYTEEIAKAYSMGATQKEIADVLGCSRSAVSYLLAAWRKENENN